eukprot:gene10240-7179_t
MRHSNGLIDVKVRCLRGETFELQVPQTCTIGDLRQFLIQSYQYNPDSVILHRGSVAPDNSLVSKYPYDTLQLNPSPNAAAVAQLRQYNRADAPKQTQNSTWKKYTTAENDTLDTNHSCKPAAQRQESPNMENASSKWDKETQERGNKTLATQQRDESLVNSHSAPSSRRVQKTSIPPNTPIKKNDSFLDVLRSPKNADRKISGDDPKASDRVTANRPFGQREAKMSSPAAGQEEDKMSSAAMNNVRSSEIAEKNTASAAPKETDKVTPNRPFGQREAKMSSPAAGQEEDKMSSAAMNNVRSSEIAEKNTASAAPKETDKVTPNRPFGQREAKMSSPAAGQEEDKMSSAAMNNVRSSEIAEKNTASAAPKETDKVTPNRPFGQREAKMSSPAAGQEEDKMSSAAMNNVRSSEIAEKNTASAAPKETDKVTPNRPFGQREAKMSSPAAGQEEDKMSSAAMNNVRSSEIAEKNTASAAPKETDKVTPNRPFGQREAKMSSPAAGQEEDKMSSAAMNNKTVQKTATAQAPAPTRVEASPRPTELSKKFDQETEKFSVTCCIPDLRLSCAVEVNSDSSTVDLVNQLKSEVPQLGPSIQVLRNGKRLPLSPSAKLFDQGIRDACIVYIASGNFSNPETVILHEVEEGVKTIEDKMNRDPTPTEKRGFYELLMRMLFSLDGLQTLEGDWRARRKNAVRKFISIPVAFFDRRMIELLFFLFTHGKECSTFVGAVSIHYVAYWIDVTQQRIRVAFIFALLCCSCKNCNFCFQCCTVKVNSNSSTLDLLNQLKSEVPQLGSSIQLLSNGKRLPLSPSAKLFDQGIRDACIVYIASGNFSNPETVILHEVEEGVKTIEDKMNRDPTPTEKRGFYELLMRMLFSLDGLQTLEGDWRARRKNAVRKVTVLQDQLNSGQT